MKMAVISTIRPGYLVGLKTSLKGNIRYDRQEIEREHITAEGELKSRWENERTISDPAEFEAAGKVRGKATSMIRGACARSAFGLLCPERNYDNLKRALADASRLVEEFNKTAQLTRVSVYSIVGRVEPNDVEAVRAIKSEISDLIVEMSNGVKNLNVEAIRAAATKAKSVGQMLDDSAQERVKGAIATARKVAREIVKQAETATAVIDKQAIRDLAEARTAFLDFEDDAAVDIKVAAGATPDLDFGPETVPVKGPSLPRLRLDS